MTDRILQILDNVRYWDTCPDDYKKDIETFLETQNQALRIKTELKLRQIFKNLSDCYADTWHSERGFMEQGEVVDAMTEDRFIEALKEAKLLPIPVVVRRSEQLVCGNCFNNHTNKEYEGYCSQSCFDGIE